VASLEHLLTLKVDAAIGRHGSAKGAKDQRDIVRILWIINGRAQGTNINLWLPYANSARVAAMRAAVNGPARLGLARGNAHLAKQLLGGAEPALEKLIAAFEA
jgi:hypothetical protein